MDAWLELTSFLTAVVISGRPVLLVMATRVPRGNHRPMVIINSPTCTRFCGIWNPGRGGILWFWSQGLKLLSHPYTSEAEKIRYFVHLFMDTSTMDP